MNSSFRNQGIRLAFSMYHGTHTWASVDCKSSNHVINDCNNSVHRLKKNGIRIMNPDNTKIVVSKYVIKIQIHLLLVNLCQKMIHHSKAREIINQAMTI